MSSAKGLCKQFIVAIFLIGIWTCSLNLMANESLQEHFVSPPDSAKPHTWWHWMNGNVSKKGITADLEAMKRVGIGGFQAFHVTDQIPAGPVGYLSAQWREMMKHTVTEADRLGLEVCLHNCAGWSSSGGPWITPEYAMQEVVWSERQVVGPKSVQVKLSQPKTRHDFYRDIVVLAFATPESEQNGKEGFRISDWKGKAGFERNDFLTPDTRTVAKGDQIDRDSIVDLSQYVDSSGLLKWQVPDGHWTIIRFGYTPNGRTNRPAPPEGIGLECDKLSIAAAEFHWKHSMQKVIDDVGPLAGKVFNNVLVDSYEVGQQNWTKGFQDEFRRQMGYDLNGFLPALTGRVVENLNITERFLWDFRRVIANMMSTNYFGHFATMAHRNQMQLSVEPYGGKSGNFDNFDVAGWADVPMGEWWARREMRWHHASGKMAASAAHTHGRRFVGAEAFTAGRAEAAFINHPYYLKAQGDYFFCQGVNRFIFHTYAHQPWMDLVPGMTMGPHGFQNNRNNTWYEPGKAWMEYLARCQYMLQEGTFQADLCYYAGENAPQTFSNREDMKPVPPDGYDYDTCSRQTLMKLTVKNGRLILPGLMEYRLLVLPNEPVRPEVLEKIYELVREGAHVVWAKPARAPGLQNYPKCDGQIRQLADEMWGPCNGKDVSEHSFGKGKIYWPHALEPILASMGIQPDVEFRFTQAPAVTLYPGNGFEWIHRRIGQADVYLLSNQQEKPRQVEAILRSDGRIPQLWNPYAGTIEQAPVFGPTVDGRTAVKLFMNPADSVFVVLGEPSDKATVVDVLHNGLSPFKKLSATKTLKIHQAVYGVLDGAKDRQVDVTSQLRKRIFNNSLQVPADNNLAGDPAPQKVKQLRVTYSLGDKQFTKVVQEKETLKLGGHSLEDFSAPSSPANLTFSSKGVVLTAWQPGDYELLYSDGKRDAVTVSSVPTPIDLTDDWTLQFPQGWGAPPEVTVDTLTSWTNHSHSDIKHFSGTAVYKKQFDVPADRLGKDKAVCLDLGDVQVMAEVIINGKNLGILWKPPFKIDISGLLKRKDNQLEVRVTNLWINRLIGDARYPDSCEWKNTINMGMTGIKEIPGWLRKGQTRPPTQQKTFVTWKFYSEDSPLVDSGLLGPVKLHFAVRENLLGH